MSPSGRNHRPRLTNRKAPVRVQRAETGWQKTGQRDNDKTHKATSPRGAAKATLVCICLAQASKMLLLFCSSSNQCNAIHEVWCSRNVNIAQIPVDYIMTENRRTDIALGQHCEDTLLALPGKSKPLLVVLSNWYGEKSISYINNYISNGRNYADSLQRSDNTDNSCIPNYHLIPFLTVHGYFSIATQCLPRPNRWVQWASLSPLLLLSMLGRRHMSLKFPQRCYIASDLLPWCGEEVSRVSTKPFLSHGSRSQCGRHFPSTCIRVTFKPGDIHHRMGLWIN